jgi:hypothetical protein
MSEHAVKSEKQSVWQHAYIASMHLQSVDLCKTGHSTCGQGKPSVHRLRKLDRFFTISTDPTTIFIFRKKKTKSLLAYGFVDCSQKPRPAHKLHRPGRIGGKR